MKKVLIVLGSGGHTAQMLRLVSLLGNRYQYEYVINDDDKVTEKIVEGQIYTIKRIRKYGDSFFVIPINIIMSFFDAVKILRKSRPYAIISSGPGLTISLFILAKLSSIKTIYIETWSRVTTKSASGKICYYLSDIFFVQWKELLKKYPKAIYAGRLG